MKGRRQRKGCWGGGRSRREWTLLASKKGGNVQLRAHVCACAYRDMSTCGGVLPMQTLHMLFQIPVSR